MEINSIFYYNDQQRAGLENAKEKRRAGKAVSSEQRLQEAEKLAEFKRKFYEDLSKTVPYQTTKNTTLIISEAAFIEMKNNPEYREKILSLIRRDWGHSYGSGKYKVLITVGADLKHYRACSWPVRNSSLSKSRRYMKKRIYKKLHKKRMEKKERLEEYLEEEMMVKRLVWALRSEEAANEMLLRKYRELWERW